METLGPLYTMSSKAVQAAGYNGAMILGHLYHLQNMTPRGGHIPTTESGERCSFNSFIQLQARFPFLSLRTIKSTIVALKKLDGFASSRVHGHKSNHYHISEELAKELDLKCKGKKLMFHRDEALLYGPFKATLLQHIGYKNANLGDPRKESIPFFITDGVTFGKSKKTIQRTIDALLTSDSDHFKCLVHADFRGGYWTNDFARLMNVQSFRQRSQSPDNSAPSEPQICTRDETDLHHPLTNLHTCESTFATQSLHNAAITRNGIPLNSIINTQSRLTSKEARALEHIHLPSVTTIVAGRWQEIDCRTPLQAPPQMDPAPDVEQAPVEPYNAQRVMAPTNASDTDHRAPIRHADSESTKRQSPDQFNNDKTNAMLASAPASRYNAIYKTFATLTENQKKFWDKFERMIRITEILDCQDSQVNFKKEISSNPELTDDVLTSIYGRVIESEKQGYAVEYADKFNPYFHSCNHTTANQVIGSFYLILQDMYRIDARTHFLTSGSKDRLREDTPEPIRRYIERKLAARH